MKISIIAAVSSNDVIGLNNGLPWHLPADMRYFQKKTVGHYLLMGRRTFESLDAPLKNRTLVVISRRPEYSLSGVLTARSLQDAIRLAEGEEEVFVAGGAEIYSEALSLAHCMYLTRIHEEFEGDTYFPKFDRREWNLIHRTDHDIDDENSYRYSFLTYERKL